MNINNKKTVTIGMLFITILLLPLLTYSQTKSVHLVKYEDNINPIFSKVSKKINISLDKLSVIDSPQSIILLKIDINDRKSELVGSGNNFGIGGGYASMNNDGILVNALASSLSSSKQYSFRNTIGSKILNRKQFDTLFNYCDKIIELMKESKESAVFDINYFFNLENLEINLESNRKISVESDANLNRRDKVIIERNVYLKIDDSIFGFKEDDFKTLYNNVLINIKNNWDNN